MGPSQAGYALSQTVPLHSSLEKGGAISPPFSQTANFVAARPYGRTSLRPTPQSGDTIVPRVRRATGAPDGGKPQAACPPIRDTTNPRVGCAAGTTAQRQAAIAACRWLTANSRPNPFSLNASRLSPQTPGLFYRLPPAGRRTAQSADFPVSVPFF